MFFSWCMQSQAGWASHHGEWVLPGARVAAPDQLPAGLPIVSPPLGLGRMHPCSQGLRAEHVPGPRVPGPILKRQPVLATKACAGGNREVSVTGRRMS